MVPEHIIWTVVIMDQAVHYAARDICQSLRFQPIIWTRDVPHALSPVMAVSRVSCIQPMAYLIRRRRRLTPALALTLQLLQLDRQVKKTRAEHRHSLLHLDLPQSISARCLPTGTGDPTPHNHPAKPASAYPLCHDAACNSMLACIPTSCALHRADSISMVNTFPPGPPARALRLRCSAACSAHHTPPHNRFQLKTSACSNDSAAAIHNPLRLDGTITMKVVEAVQALQTPGGDDVVKYLNWCS